MKLNLVKRAKGQALVVFLGFAAAMIGMLLVSFNSGQVTNAKMRAMNAADAAAYSGAVWEARTLNFQAYMNRAMVVNEVTIAQSVSLRSWIDYMAKFVSNINMITQFIPYLGEVTIEISQALNQVDNAMQGNMPVFERLARGLARSEHAAQEIFHKGASAGAWDIARDVAARNGAEISVGGDLLIAKNAEAWLTFTNTYSTGVKPKGTSGDGRKRLRAVTLDSRDGFTQNRPWNPGFLIAKIDKQGGTDLVDYDAWKGLDSAQLCWFRVFRSCRGVPLAWGGAQAYSTNTAKQGIGTHGNGGNWNRQDGRWARDAANDKLQAARMTGAFPDYRDLMDLDPANTAKQKMSFAVEVIIADTKVPTANTAFGAKAALIDGTTIDHDPQYAAADKGVYGLAEACVAFERPAGESRKDGGVERPSLFSPYWRASLATPSMSTRIVAGLAKKLPAVEAFVGDGSCG